MRATQVAIPRPAHVPTSTSMRRVGLVLTGLSAAFLLFDGAARVVGFAPYAEGTVRAGYPVEMGPVIGLVLIVSTLLYLLPRTAVLGAVLLTGYLGAATATNLRTEDPFLFPLVFGIVVWAGLYLRDAELRALLPVRKEPPR